MQMAFRKSDDWDNPDRVQYGSRSVIGAPGTFNHLTDAILDVTATRTMYMRRLRTLADKYYGQNRLRQVGGRICRNGVDWGAAQRHHRFCSRCKWLSLCWDFLQTNITC
eukprot:GHRQ01033903.1.p2 GENE.GHRQ01033903.1~~GHRQ01033903.1.p2  ORF type:complete len:109 (+),score=22.98 GHRQ01033903.1:268-594(+)